ncbi:MAG: glycosyltransferase [Deltaproteobacteria bacterium]|jgi:glycosyltransferase involved in cell wall biosynthesis|nr:glycosyltransferase [Deltaproteobacteria bacterium]
MKILFIHQNFPGQYLRLVQHLRDLGGHEILGIGETGNIRNRGMLRGVALRGYSAPKESGSDVHHYLRDTQTAVRRGQNVARILLALRAEGYAPDVISVHPGWGEGLFARDVFPRVPLLMYCEFFFSAETGYLDFDPEFPATVDGRFSLRIRNAVQLISLPAADALVSPTAWQRSRYPALLRRGIRKLHDGIDADYMRPDSGAALALAPLSIPGESLLVQEATGKAISAPEGLITLRPGDKTITYAARNLEPHRGIHRFLRALPEVLRRHPDCRVLLAGADGVSYSQIPPDKQTYKARYLAELEGQLDLSRIHFLGRVSYADLRRIFQVSAVHVYLTYPFVLSWSVLEAMACGCLVLASRTAPVQEVVRHKRNGLLVDFFDQQGLVQALDTVLDRPGDFARLRAAARRTILSRYNLSSCLEGQTKLLLDLAAGKYTVPAGRTHESAS